MTADTGDAESKPRHAHDDRLIDLDNPAEAAYWLKWLDASEREVRDAIRAVGPTASAVKLYLTEMRKDPGAS